MRFRGLSLVVAGAAALALTSASASASAPASASASASTPPAPVPPPVTVLSQPDEAFTYENPSYYPSLAWMLAQLVPSPEVAVGRTHRIDALGRVESETPVAFGLRWQMTPVLWSWGVHRRLDRWRWFVVDPLARVSGSVELDLNLEYLWGHVDRMLVRPGVRANFPLVQRGEYLSMSLGTSTYQYDGAMHVAYDVGAYVLFGVLGAQVTVAPAHNPLTTIATLRLRFF
jgi:hypothetical protein